MSRPPTRILIVNADDFGITAGVTRGILRAHDVGIVTSTTVLVGGLAADQALAAARQRPRLGVGVHLALAGAIPCATPDATPTLRNSSGQFWPFGTLVRRLLSGAIREADIVAEFRAQVTRARDAGVRVTHLDAHRHTMVIPVVWRALVSVAQELGISAVRWPVELDGGPALPAVRLKRWVMRTGMLIGRGSVRGPGRPDHFWGVSAMGREDFRAKLLAFLGRIEPGITEIMVHPGEVDDDLRRADAYVDPRAVELGVLTDPAVRSRCDELGITLGTFGVFAASGAGK